MGISDTDLYKQLIENHYLSENELNSALEFSERKKIPLYEALLEKDLITDENIGKLIADFFNVPYVSLSKTSIRNDVLSLIPEEVAGLQKTIAFGTVSDGIQVATVNPQNMEFFQMLAKKVGSKVYLYFATDRDIEETLRLYKKELQQSFDDLISLQQGGKDQKGEAPVSRIVDQLIEHASDNKASDVHIEPTEQDSVVRFRVDGVLRDVLIVPKSIHEQIVTRIKVLASLRTDEHLSSQDGKLVFKVPKGLDEKIDVRVSIVPIIKGEKVVLRLLSSHYRQFGLADLGMSDADLEKVKKSIQKPFGMILSTGPTGSGKTTTMYAILKILNNRDKNIATIEDPVEYDVEGLNQIQVNPKTNLTFASGLRSILRQDPDIIYVGEIRDEETADIAINSAMTGHLVLSTLHTNNAATAIPRMTDMKVEPFLISSTVNVIIGQRLVRKICEKCKVSYVMAYDQLSKSFKPEEIKNVFGEESELTMYRGKGCAVCHQTGYVGRVGIFEVLDVTTAIQGLINAKADSDEIIRKAMSEGMTTMLEDGLGKVGRGQTTLQEVLRVTSE